MAQFQPGVGPINERLRLIRMRMAHEDFRFRDEIRIIPRQLVYLVVALYFVALIVFQLANRYVKEFPFADFPRPWGELATIGAVTAGAIAVAVFIFLFGYIAADAKRRGMNPWLWTPLAIFVPYLIGVVIYFVLREPMGFNCPQCNAKVAPRFIYCPNCSCNLRPSCPQCKREVREGDKYCPYCAHPLTA